MIKQAWDITWTHIKIGYVSFLLIVDCLLLAWLAIDLHRYLQHGKSFAFAASLMDAGQVLSVQALLYGANLGVVLIIVGPIFVAYLRISGGAGRNPGGKLSVRGRTITALHLLLSAAVVGGHFFMRAAGYASGSSLASDDTLYFGFSSSFEVWIVHGLAVVATPLGIIGASFFNRLVPTTVLKAELSDGAKAYLARMKLADLSGSLYPVSGRHQMNFNTAGASPEIRLAREYLDCHMKVYERLAPSSREAADFLKGVAEQCRDRLRDLFLRSAASDCAIEFLPGTGRALEVAVSRLGVGTEVIVSPYEHPTEVDVLKHYQSLTGTPVHFVPIPSLFFHNTPDEQVSYVLGAISGNIGSTRSVLLLISEVCWATGTVVPVGDLISALRAKLTGRSVRVIIDGSHSVGNLESATGLCNWDAYVFSAHKWLRSSEPCGVLLTKDKAASVATYDSWAKDVPVSFSSARMICAFRASLEIFREVEFSHLSARSTALREHFKTAVRENIKFVGIDYKHEGTSMLSIEPADGHVWSCGREGLRSHFLRRSVHALVFQYGDHRPWVRLAFPYFLDVQKVDLLSRAVRDVVK